MQTKVTGILWTVVAATVVLLAGAPAAQAQDKVVATVPFSFMVGKVQLPAGDYTIAEEDGGNVVKIADDRNHNGSFALTMNGSIDERNVQPELVFDKIGSTYFLSQIVIDAGNVRELPISPAMKAHAAEHVAVVLRPMTHVS